MSRNYRNFIVWQYAHRLTLNVYRVTASYPTHELFGLTSQTRRASASIGSNIAEGCGRSTDNDFRRFLHIALGSASELNYHLLLAFDLGILKLDTYSRLDESVNEVQRMLNGLIKKLSKNC